MCTGFLDSTYVPSPKVQYQLEILRDDLLKKSNKFKFHLEHYDDKEPTVKKGVDQCNILKP